MRRSPRNHYERTAARRSSRATFDRGRERKGVGGCGQPSEFGRREASQDERRTARLARRKRNAARERASIRTARGARGVKENQSFVHAKGGHRGIKG